MNNASLELGGDNWAAKDGNLLGYAVGDSSGKYVPNEFTFARGSNLSATRVNADGLIEKGRENIVLHSNDFSQSSWAKLNGASVSSTQVADPFGGTNAWELTFATNNDSRIQQQVTTVNNTVYAFSFWARVTSGTKIVYLGAIGNLQQKTLTTTWQRFESFAVETDTNGFPQIRKKNSEGEYTIQIYGFQLELGTVATSYIESGASTAKAGVLENEPRIDYSDGTASLLLEPQRTNALPHSEYLNAISSKSNSLEMNTSDTKSPEGVHNASKFDFTSGIRYIGPPIGALNDVVVSVFAKAGTHNFVQFVSSGTNQFSINFDLSNGTSNVIGTAPSELQYDAEDYGNGWYRIWFYYDNAGISSSVYCWIVDSLTSSRASSVSTSGIVYLYGYQVEQDATYPTSYIPTYGTSQTRLKDTQAELTIPNGSTTEGTIFYEFDKAQAPTSYDITPLKIGSDRMLRISQYNPNMRFSINENATYYNEPNSYNSHIKVAVSYAGSVVKLFINGNLRATDNTYSGSGSVIVPTYGLQSTLLDCSIESKQLLYFPEALSDDECIELTTI